MCRAKALEGSMSEGVGHAWGGAHHSRRDQSTDADRKSDESCLEGEGWRCSDVTSPKCASCCRTPTALRFCSCVTYRWPDSEPRISSSTP